MQESGGCGVRVERKGRGFRGKDAVNVGYEGEDEYEGVERWRGCCSKSRSIIARPASAKQPAPRLAFIERQSVWSRFEACAESETVMWPVFRGGAVFPRGVWDGGAKMEVRGGALYRSRPDGLYRGFAKVSVRSEERRVGKECPV